MRAKLFPSGLVGLPLIKVSIFAPPTSLSLSPLKQKLKPEKYQLSERKTWLKGEAELLACSALPVRKVLFPSPGCSWLLPSLGILSLTVPALRKAAAAAAVAPLKHYLPHPRVRRSAGAGSWREACIAKQKKSGIAVKKPNTHLPRWECISIRYLTQILVIFIILSFRCAKSDLWHKL